MDYIFKKRTALLVILTYFFIMVLPGYSLGQANANDLEEAKNLYRKGRYDKAIELFDRFIKKTIPTKSLYTNELSEAYYYKAKMYFTGEDNAEMKKNLRELYEINPSYQFPGDDETNFLKLASEIKSQWEKENTEKQKEEQKRIEKEKREKEKKAEEEIKTKELEQKIRNQIELERNISPKKKFPWLVVIGVVVAGVVAAVLMSKKKTEKEKTLNVTIGEGIDGSPATGTYMNKQGSSINYSYTLKSGYANLSVKLDGVDVSNSGIIAMDKDNTLSASATAKHTYILTVMRGEGIDGNPASGTFSYNDGDKVNYSYTLQSEYQNLAVTLDGVAASASGTITMNANHTLSASATKINVFTLTVTRGPGVNGDPTTGIYSYNQGAAVSYSYTLIDNTYKDLIVKIDGASTSANGTITMNGNHTLSATATKIYQLTVSLAEGVDGTPGQGSHIYNADDIVPYNYSLKTGYKDLTVTIDGTAAAASGTIIMDKNHIISVSAVKNQYKLTIIKGDGVNGTPESGTYYYNEGTKVSYSYKIAGSSGSMIVNIDGGVKPPEGSITMDHDHTLIATWQSPGDYKFTNSTQEPIATPGKSI